MLGLAVRGEALLGTAWLGRAGFGAARHGMDSFVTFQGLWRGGAGPGWVRQVKSRLGKALSGKERQGEAW